MLTRIAPDLRAFGILFDRTKGTRGERIITIENVMVETPPTPLMSNDGSNQDENSGITETTQASNHQMELPLTQPEAFVRPLNNSKCHTDDLENATVETKSEQGFEETKQRSGISGNQNKNLSNSEISHSPHQETSQNQHLTFQKGDSVKVTVGTQYNGEIGEVKGYVTFDGTYSVIILRDKSVGYWKPEYLQKVS